MNHRAARADAKAVFADPDLPAGFGIDQISDDLARCIGFDRAFGYQLAILRIAKFASLKYGVHVEPVEGSVEDTMAAVIAAIDAAKSVDAAELGRRGGQQTAKRGPEYFREIAAKRKSYRGGRPRLTKEDECQLQEINKLKAQLAEVQRLLANRDNPAASTSQRAG